jgi:hypothetical protein
MVMKNVIKSSKKGDRRRKMDRASEFIHNLDVMVKVNLKVIEEMEKQLDEKSSAGVFIRELNRLINNYYGREE